VRNHDTERRQQKQQKTQKNGNFVALIRPLFIVAEFFCLKLFLLINFRQKVFSKNVLSNPKNHFLSLLKYLT
jgi:hypothetical protein